MGYIPLPSYTSIQTAVTEKDNHKIKQVLISVMTEFGVPDHGTALQDDELDNMSNAYIENNSIYYVNVRSLSEITLHGHQSTALAGVSTINITTFGEGNHYFTTVAEKKILSSVTIGTIFWMLGLLLICLSNSCLFISKIFMGGSFNEIVALGKKIFKEVKVFKPKSSRKDSKESFIICKNLR